MSGPDDKYGIEGTTIFDGAMALKGYALNKMCFSFNKAINRKRYKGNPAAYCDEFDLTPQQKSAVLELDILKLIELGGSIYYLAKLTGIHGMNVQDCGAHQRGVTVEEFQALLEKAGQE